MDGDVLVSVLMPMHNMKDWLRPCLDSLWAQTEQRFEVVLVDNGSDDGSGQLAEAISREHPQLRVFHQPNAGVSGARNAAMAQARGGLFFPVDADDWLEPDCLATLLRLMEDTGAPVTACNHYIERQGRRETCFPESGEVRLLDARQALEGVLYHQVPDVSCWGKLWDRRLFEGLRYPEGKLYEDTWLIAPLLLRAGRMAWTPKPGYHYRIRSDSISRSVWGPEKLDFIEAVEQLTGTAAEAFPDLEAGCVRRRCHARLSLLRYFVKCPAEWKEQKQRLVDEALALAPGVLRDPKAPRRDILALRALQVGPWCYDLLWRLNERRQGL